MEHKTQNKWKPQTKTEKIFYITAKLCAIAGVISCTLYLLDISEERAPGGLFLALMMISYGIVYRKRSRLLAVVMWIVATMTLYTVTETVLLDHFGIFIGTWRH